MTAPVILGAVLAALVVGYWLGRSRPYASTSHKAWLRGIAFPASEADVKWGYLWLALHPLKALRAWRRKNEPRRLAPAPVLIRPRPSAPEETP